jgi:hypothetical protein
MPVVFKDRVADRNSLVADVGARVIAGRRDQLPNDVLTFVAEGAAERVVGTGTFHAVISGEAGSQR